MEKEKEGRSFGIVFIPSALPTPHIWLWVKSGMSHCQQHEVISPQRSLTLNPGATTTPSKLVYTSCTRLPIPSCKAGQKVTVIRPHQAIISPSLSFFKAAKTHPHPCTLEEDLSSYNKWGVKTPVARGWDSVPNGAWEKGNSPPYFPVNQCSIDVSLPIPAHSTGLYPH